MDFYLLKKDGERTGPFKIFHVVEMLRSEEVKETDMGWCSANDHWMPLKDIPALKGLIEDSEDRSAETEAEVLPMSRRHTRGDDDENSARPWMRFLARVLDCSIAFHLVAFAAGLNGLKSVIKSAPKEK